MARAGIGRRTRQYNPGARTLAEYVQAVTQHRRGAHDEAGRIIHETPKETRRALAAAIWRRRWSRYPQCGRRDCAGRADEVPF